MAAPRPKVRLYRWTFGGRAAVVAWGWKRPRVNLIFDLCDLTLENPNGLLQRRRPPWLAYSPSRRECVYLPPPRLPPLAGRARHQSHPTSSVREEFPCKRKCVFEVFRISLTFMITRAPLFKNNKRQARAGCRWEAPRRRAWGA